MLLKNPNFAERGSCFNLISAFEASDRSGCSWLANRTTGRRDRV